MKKLIYILLALPLLAAKCEKDQPTVAVINTPTPTDSTATDSTITELDKLPSITSTGANTFGCLLNGKAWLPTSGGTTNPKLSVDYFNGRFFVRGSIYGYNFNSQQTDILSTVNVYLDSALFSPKEYHFGKSGACFLVRDFITECYYFKDETLSGKIIISKIDTTKRILSGQFDFVVFGPQNNCDSVVVTDGRFDVKY